MKRWMSLYRDAVALAYTRYTLGPKATRLQFRQDVTELFRDVNHALAKESMNVLRRHVIEVKMPMMKQLIKSRKKKGWHEVDWKLDSLDKLSVSRAEQRLFLSQIVLGQLLS